MPATNVEWVHTAFRLNHELFKTLTEYVQWMESDEGLKISRPSRHDAFSRLLRIGLETEFNNNTSYHDFVNNRKNA